MAWIQVEHATLDKPEIRTTARMLGIKHGEALELYLRWWLWLDLNSVDGRVDGFVDSDVDDLLRCPGLAACMRAVKWLETGPVGIGLQVVGFDKHNGESSKKRALRNRRQAKWRENVDACVDTGASQKASTREDKIREEVTTSSKEKTGPRKREPSPANDAINGNGQRPHRGTRLSEGWELPEPWKQWALAYRTDWDERACLRESLVFRDFWLGKSGKDGTKDSWVATWRNWVRRAK